LLAGQHSQPPGEFSLLEAAQARPKPASQHEEPARGDVVALESFIARLHAGLHAGLVSVQAVEHRAVIIPDALTVDSDVIPLGQLL